MGYTWTLFQTCKHLFTAFKSSGFISLFVEICSINPSFYFIFHFCFFVGGAGGGQKLDTLTVYQ